MTTRTAALLVALVAVAVPAFAEEGPGSHADHPQKVVSIGASRISPVELKMGTGDVLSFQNFSGSILKITFLEPKDLASHVKCSQVKRISPNEAVVAGALFQRQGDEVVGYVAPGAFVSVCSLQPGRYVYTVAPIATTGGTPGGDDLGQKGEIVVE